VEKDPRRFSICDRTWREKGTWTQTGPSIAATSRRGQRREGGERRCEWVWEAIGAIGGQGVGRAEGV
jgi:hypothetical protein